MACVPLTRAGVSTGPSCCGSVYHSLELERVLDPHAVACVPLTRAGVSTGPSCCGSVYH